MVKAILVAIAGFSALIAFSNIFKDESKPAAALGFTISACIPIILIYAL
jgi:hypothetical protein